MKILANYAYVNSINVHKNNQKRLNYNNKSNSISQNINIERLKYYPTFQGTPVVSYGEKLKAISNLTNSDGTPLISDYTMENLKSYPLIIWSAYEALPKPDATQTEKDMFRIRMEELDKYPMQAEELLFLRTDDNKRRFNFTDIVMLAETTVKHPAAVKFLVASKTPEDLYGEVRPYRAEEIANLAPEMDMVMMLEKAFNQN